MRQLTDKVILWAQEIGIFAKSTAEKQFLKTVEEVGELADALGKDNEAMIIDAVGDIQVTLILLCEMKNIDYDSCLQSAYDVISKRTGSMQGGLFVKDA